MHIKQLPGTFLDDMYNQDCDKADVVTFGVAYETTTSYGKGTSLGPDAIFDASYQIEYEVPGTNVTLTEAVLIHSKGILTFDNAVPKDGWAKATEQMLTQVAELASPILKAKKLLMMFGGEHSVTHGVARALTKEYDPKQVTFIQFDAHLDLRNEFDGTKLSHAAVMRRVHELGFPIVAIGVRDHICEEEQAVVKQHDIPVWWCATQPRITYKDPSKHIFNGALSEEQLEAIAQKITTPYAYITFDADCLDPVHMPGTGTPLPNGMSFRGVQEALYSIMQHLKKKNITLLGFDIVEVAPQIQGDVYDHNNCFSTQSEMNAAILAYNILQWNFEEKIKKIKN